MMENRWFFLRPWVCSLIFFVNGFSLANAEETTVSTIDAPEIGSFNIGPSTGKFSKVLDSETNKPVIRYEYKAPLGTFVGIWTKGYGSSLGAGSATQVETSVKTETEGTAGEIAVSLEIKGSQDVQRIPLLIKQKGWAVASHPVDWARVGDLKEVVFVIAPVGKERQGVLCVNARFSKEIFLTKANPQKGFNLFSAGASGVFNIGTAQAVLGVEEDPKSKKKIHTLNYTLPSKTTAGLWAKDFPAGLNSTKIQGLRLAVFTPKESQAQTVSVALEIKGKKETQTLPVVLRRGWVRSEETLAWDTLGDLREVTLVVSSLGLGKKATGNFKISVDFLSHVAPRSVLPKTSNFSFQDAQEKGVFNMGRAEAVFHRVYDETHKRNVEQFNFTAHPGSVVGLWSKSYPIELSSTTANTVRVHLKSAKIPSTFNGTVTLELKGGKDLQSVPLPMGDGWTLTETVMDWEKLGVLKEVVFTFTPAGPQKMTGTYLVDVEFIQKEIRPVLTKRSDFFSFQDGAERGGFNVGEGEALVSVSTDTERGHEFLLMDFTANEGTVVGAWTKTYPRELSTSVNMIRAYVKRPTAQDKNHSLLLELKGDKGVQTIPLDLGEGWTATEEALLWEKIGHLNEAVFVVKPNRSKKSAGRFSFDLEFLKGVPVKKAPPVFPLGKRLGLVSVVALLVAFLVFLGKKLGGQKNVSPEISEDPKSAGEIFFHEVRKDVVYALVAVLAGVGSWLIFFGGTDRKVLAVAVLGGLVGTLLRWAKTGQFSNGLETFQNIFLSGFLAACSGTVVLWQAPESWADVLLLSPLTAWLTFVVYHVTNYVVLANREKPLRPVSAFMMVGTPALFGLLLMLQQGDFLQKTAMSWGLGGLRTLSPLFTENVLRFLILFFVNEVLANGLGLAVKGQWLKTVRAHFWVLVISAGAILAPTVADLGSSLFVLRLSKPLGSVIAVVTGMLSQAGLWMEVYFITGIVLDALYGFAPNGGALLKHSQVGFKKGMAYSGIFLGILYFVKTLVETPGVWSTLTEIPLLTGTFLGALVFPTLKTIIESFDGSMPFFQRLRYSYKNGVLYTRGLVAGGAIAWGISHGVVNQDTADRFVFGLLAGVLPSAGVSFLRDVVNGFFQRGRVQTWKVYLVDGCLGGFMGMALAFYLDSHQILVITDKMKLYTSSGFDARPFDVYALISKWARVDLGTYTGGVRLLFDEALAGVITWSIAAWLFAINRVFLQAWFAKDKRLLRRFFSGAGAKELVVNMIHVLRWGLWMSPIINTGLRMMGTATWYNQDGAIRTVVALFKNITLSPADFQVWSLAVFVSLLAHNSLRILIWMDHMGLRVATLVNLSFLGMDRLDEKLARFIGPSSAQRCIPEAVKRFTTWAPLLIPFYIPRGADWDYAWSKSQEMMGATSWSWGTQVNGPTWLGIGVLALLGTALLIHLIRVWEKRRNGERKGAVLSNMEYRVAVDENGAVHSEILTSGYDLTRRSYDTVDPAGRAFFLVDTQAHADSPARSWPVMGNAPADKFKRSVVEGGPHSLWLVHEHEGIKCTIEITLPDKRSTTEIWTVQIENTEDKPRSLQAVPYVEWVLDRPESDRGHTQYGRLFPEMEYVASANALLAWQKKTKTMGYLASAVSPTGFHTARMDFIGRARSLWKPRLLETMDFLEPKNTAPYPTFDPIGSLSHTVSLAGKETKTLRYTLGFAKTRDEALTAIQKNIEPKGGKSDSKSELKIPLIGHGEITPGTPQPYSEFLDGGNTLRVLTPFTPRPYDHALSNGTGHYVMVTNRGLHMTSNGNSQQNPITPDWADTVTREVPAEAIYLYDVEENEWYSPTHHPLNDPLALNTCDFRVDGTATFRMTRGVVSTEMTVFVPPTDTCGVYLLTIKNNGSLPRKMRVAPYFQITLSGQGEPQRAALQESCNTQENALLFENPVNSFRVGPAFASVSFVPERMETRRGRFLGRHGSVTHPQMVETGQPDEKATEDDRAIAAFIGTVEIPAKGERTIAVVLGQADTEKQAIDLVRKYKNIEAARESLEKTKTWWTGLMSTLKITTNKPEFDRYQNWLKYQAVAERLWARRGFYQTSGAYGFRDQLQDTVNLIWVDPALARKQILLHASQQFIEGDVVHWFHTLHDGRTAFSNRSHASDNLLWLAWGAAEYVRLSGDETILDEITTYLKAENPFPPLPKNKHGWGTIYLRSAIGDTVYRHSVKSIDLVLEKRMGKNGLPLIGTGDWNDGLDEIGSEGRGESVWLGFFLHYILKNMVDIIEKKDGRTRKEYYLKALKNLEIALEKTWRGDRYLRAFHDDGTEIGVKDSGVWEIDALTAAWAVYANINPERSHTVFQTALTVLEKKNAILLGWPALREDTKPYLGRSSHYPEGVRENGMYCHGVQWLVRAARLLAEQADKEKNKTKADDYRATAWRLWRKIAPVSHVEPGEIEIYGGQPNKQSADLLTTFDRGRMIWHGYTGAAGWMLRQSMEGVIGATLNNNTVVLPSDMQAPRGDLLVSTVTRDLSKSPL